LRVSTRRNSPPGPARGRHGDGLLGVDDERQGDGAEADPERCCGNDVQGHEPDDGADQRRAHQRREPAAAGPQLRERQVHREDGEYHEHGGGRGLDDRRQRHRPDEREPESGDAVDRTGDEHDHQDDAGQDRRERDRHVRRLRPAEHKRWLAMYRPGTAARERRVTGHVPSYRRFPALLRGRERLPVTRRNRSVR
jgi:hypothetical protein